MCVCVCVWVCVCVCVGGRGGGEGGRGGVVFLARSVFIYLFFFFSARAILRAVTSFQTNKRSCGHQIQSDWPYLAGPVFYNQFRN